MHAIKVSVIIPAWNEAENLKELIPLLVENRGDFVSEIILVDGGSIDGTAQLAARLGAKVFYSDQKSRAIQLNLGASKASGDILFFVHADTRPVKTYAEDVLTAVKIGYQAGCFRSRSVLAPA